VQLSSVDVQVVLIATSMAIAILAQIPDVLIYKPKSGSSLLRRANSLLAP
jgi:hypothetical protein